MRPLINTPEDIARLMAIAQSWVGTSYVADGASKGVGSSCSMLPYAILTEFGFLTAHPPGRNQMPKKEILPLMVADLASREGISFQRIAAVASIECGDVLVFDAGIGHMVLALSKRTGIHSWQNVGAHMVVFDNKPFINRIVGIWRPVISG